MTSVAEHVADAEDQAVKAIVALPAAGRASDPALDTAIAGVHAQIATANALMAIARAIQATA